MRILFIHADAPANQKYCLQFLVETIQQIDQNALIVNAGDVECLPLELAKEPVDIVLLFTEKAYSFFEKHLQDTHCVIFITCLSVQYTLAALDVTRIDKFIFLNDTGASELELKFPDEIRCSILPIIYNEKTLAEESMGKTRPGILLVNDYAEGLYESVLEAQVKVANSIINKYGQNCTVTFLSEKPIPDSIFNENISVKIMATQNELQEAFAQECKKQDIFIGYGSFAHQACISDLDVIVTGKKGYGGRITISNQNAQLLNHFEGRLGGNINEFIPHVFIEEDIFEILEESAEVRSKNKVALSTDKIAFSKKMQEKAETFIKKTVLNKQLNENDFNKRKFCLSKDYQVVNLQKACFLINNNTLKTEFEFGMQEYALLQRFQNITLVDELLHEFTDKSDEEAVREFVFMLYKNKVLINKD